MNSEIISEFFQIKKTLFHFQNHSPKIIVEENSVTCLTQIVNELTTISNRTSVTSSPISNKSGTSSCNSTPSFSAKKSHQDISSPVQFDHLVNQLQSLLTVLPEKCILSDDTYENLKVNVQSLSKVLTNIKTRANFCENIPYSKNQTKSASIKSSLKKSSKILPTPHPTKSVQFSKTITYHSPKPDKSQTSMFASQEGRNDPSSDDLILTQCMDSLSQSSKFINILGFRFMESSEEPISAFITIERDMFQAGEVNAQLVKVEVSGLIVRAILTSKRRKSFLFRFFSEDKAETFVRTMQNIHLDLDGFMKTFIGKLANNSNVSIYQVEYQDDYKGKVKLISLRRVEM